MTNSSDHTLDLRTIADGAAKLLDNAARLREEAVLLHQAGGLSRSLCLHQISLEECAKIEMLGAIAAGVLSGSTISTVQLSKALASHRAKNFANAYFLPVDEVEEKAKQDKNWHGATSAFKQLQAQFHTESNNAKNASLYVDFVSDQFVSPAERIDEGMVKVIAARNDEFLALSAPKVEMLHRWVSDAEKAGKQMTWMKGRLEELAKTDDPQAALSAFLEEAMDRFKPKRGDKSS